MRVRILGSAAGGGLPQWNCRCANCVAVRAGAEGIEPRTQSSVAVSAEDRTWFLLNVSADVRQQMLGFSSLWPPQGSTRGTTIGGCLLTDAEIDHTSGLLQLREGCRFGIFSTSLVHRWLREYLPFETILAGFARRPWTHLPLNDSLQLPLPDGSPSGLVVEAFETGRDVPRYVPESAATAVGSIIGLTVHDTRTGGKLVYAPGVAAIGGSLKVAAQDADCILMDGTFWTDDEPRRMDITDRSARQMGHVPVSGDDGSLNWLAGIPTRHRVYIHINNTNPMLNHGSPEFRQVQDRGVRVGADGDDFEL